MVKLQAVTTVNLLTLQDEICNQLLLQLKSKGISYTREVEQYNKLRTISIERVPRFKKSPAKAMVPLIAQEVVSLENSYSPEELYEVLKVNFLKASLGSVQHNPVRYGAGTEE